MGFFSIIETFFFISLGITILLVALLVYHFKQRVSSLEQKYESLFDIVSNVAKQLSNIQSAMNSQPIMQRYDAQELYQQMNGLAYLGNINIPSKEYQPHALHNINGGYMQNDGLSNDRTVKKLHEEDDSDENVSEEDDSEEDESSVDDSTDDDSDDEESHDNDSSESSNDSDDYNEPSEERIIVSDDETGKSESVKIINLNANVSVENTEQYSEKGDSLNDIDVEIYELPVQDENIVEYTESNTDEPNLLVKKIDEIVADDSVVIVEKTSAKELYKKMTLSNLKATVVSKGLCSDPSKMKKNDLLKLLEEE
jgi:hypothetical protein